MFFAQHRAKLVFPYLVPFTSGTQTVAFHFSFQFTSTTHADNLALKLRSVKKKLKSSEPCLVFVDLRIFRSRFFDAETEVPVSKLRREDSSTFDCPVNTRGVIRFFCMI